MAETSSPQNFDLIIIGAGPGGYVCAIRAAQLGMKVALVEKNATLGGTCLNIGCIPSKALLHATEAYAEAGHSFAKMGIKVTPSFDLGQMMRFKQEAVDGNVKGVDFLMKKNKVTVIKGEARILTTGKLQVGGDVLQARHIVIATGSDVARLAGVTIDEKKIVSSTGALQLTKVPKKLAVIGAGVIGLELGSVYARLGAEVTVIEYLEGILPGADREMAKAFQRILQKQGLNFQLATKVTKAETTNSGVTLTLEPAQGGTPSTLEADIVLVAIGRVPNTTHLGCEEAGIARDAKGRITVDDHYATSLAGVYAIGDVIKGPMLAHKAEDEAVAVVELLAGQAGHVNYEVIPGVVYTSPELASVGRTEEELTAAGIKYVVGKFQFSANGRAKSIQKTDGFVKIIADATTDRVLGAHILGHMAGELIHEIAVLMEFKGSAEDLARTCHAHPTLSEAVREAALAVAGRALHA